MFNTSKTMLKKAKDYLKPDELALSVQKNE